MALTVTHLFVSPVADQGDPNALGPDEWNADHVITGNTSRTILDQDTTFYIETTGSDITGDGAIDNPYATLQQAWVDTALRYDGGGFVPTFQIGPGSYPNFDTFNAFNNFFSGSMPSIPYAIIRGDNSGTPSNVLLNGRVANNTPGLNIWIGGLSIYSVGETCLEGNFGGTFTIGDPTFLLPSGMIFGGSKVGGFPVMVSGINDLNFGGGTIVDGASVISPYSLLSGTGYFINASTNISIYGPAWTLTGTPAWTGGFTSGDFPGFLGTVAVASVTGTATGPRGSYTAGFLASYTDDEATIPGNAPAVVDAVSTLTLNNLGKVKRRVAPAFTFASLPVALQGMLYTVTDSTTAVIGAAIAGGGLNTVLAWYNGANWIVVA